MSLRACSTASPVGLVMAVAPVSPSWVVVSSSEMRSWHRSRTCPGWYSLLSLRRCTVGPHPTPLMRLSLLVPEPSM
eukprot:3698791-Pyramimonas_sp.AAC.1